MIDDEIAMEAEAHWYESERRQRAEEEEQAAHFRDECEETADQINYLTAGYFPIALRSIGAEKCVEALTMAHVFESFPDLSFLKEEESR